MLKFFRRGRGLGEQLQSIITKIINNWSTLQKNLLSNTYHIEINNLINNAYLKISWTLSTSPNTVLRSDLEKCICTLVSFWLKPFTVDARIPRKGKKQPFKVYFPSRNKSEHGKQSHQCFTLQVDLVPPYWPPFFWQKLQLNTTRKRHCSPYFSFSAAFGTNPI